MSMTGDFYPHGSTGGGGGANPAGSGSEIQIRASGTSLAAITDSSFSGTDLTLPVTLLGLLQLTVDNLRVDGNTISTTNADGSITFTPNGAGQVLFPIGTKAAPAWAFAAATSRGIYAANGGTHFSVGGVNLFGVDPTAGALVKAGFQFAFSAGDPDSSSPDVGFVRHGAAVVCPTDGTASGAGTIGFRERTAPTAAADQAIVFAQDNGGGKTQLMVLMPTGAAIQLAIEA